MRQMIKRLVISLLILLLLIIVGGVGWLYWRVRASLPQLEERFKLPGYQRQLRSYATRTAFLTFVPPRSRTCSSRKVT